MARFEAQLRAFQVKTEAKANRVVLLAVLEVRSRLIIRSPVDTGRFRGNWQYGLDVAPSGALATTDKAGASTLGRIQAAIPRRAAGHVHYLVNNLSYGQVLEEGGSKQAPNGMVRITLMEWDQIVEQANTAAEAA